jgi:hypothetical protein
MVGERRPRGKKQGDCHCEDSENQLILFHAIPSKNCYGPSTFFRQDAALDVSLAIALDIIVCDPDKSSGKIMAKSSLHRLYTLDLEAVAEADDG